MIRPNKGGMRAVSHNFVCISRPLFSWFIIYFIEAFSFFLLTFSVSAVARRCDEGMLKLLLFLLRDGGCLPAFAPLTVLAAQPPPALFGAVIVYP